MYYANIPLLNDRDVLLVTYPGSGTTWLANVLSELQLPYVDGYTEKLLDKGSQATEIFEPLSRQRTPALGPSKLGSESSFPGRIIKTHYWPTYFESSPINRIILLVRDGRDAVLSYYHWRLSFSEEGETGSFQEFLRRPGFNGVTPLHDWAQTIDLWQNAPFVRQICLLRLEVCKAEPLTEIERLLRFLEVERTADQICEAADRSTFEKMREAEERAVDKNPALGSGYIMRKGTAGQWRDTFSQADLELLEGKPSQVLVSLGYSNN